MKTADRKVLESDLEVAREIAARHAAAAAGASAAVDWLDATGESADDAVWSRACDLLIRWDDVAQQWSRLVAKLEDQIAADDARGIECADRVDIAASVRGMP